METQDWPEPDTSGFQWRQGLVTQAKILVIASAGVTILGHLGALAWTLELFSHFIAWYALGSSVLAIALWRLGARRWAAGALILTLIQAAQPLAWYLPASTTTTERGVPCRILLANVLTSNTNTAALLDLIAATDPDVICVQEVNQAWADALESLKTAYPMHRIIARPDNFGIALYSRISPDAPEVMPGDSLHVPALTVSLQKNGASARLLTLHTLPPMRAALAEQRNAQLDVARVWYQTQETPSIIVGDLNMTMYSPIYRRWLANLDLKNAREGHGPLGTWPAWIPFLRLPLDQCLVSSEIFVANCQLGPNIGSDHRPIIVDVLLPF